MYKIITCYTHCSVNANRLVLHEEINDQLPMLCFMQILFKELTSTNIRAADIQQFTQYIEDSEYDTESVIGDVYYEMNNMSNIRKYCESNQQHKLFIFVRDVINKFNEPAQIHQ
eukprot:214119_1